MAIDLIFMGSSADRSAADVALPVAAGERFITANGVPGTGDEIYPKAPGAVKGAFVRSETAAMVECWLAKTDDKNRNKIVAPSLQTDPVRENIITPMNYPLEAGDALEAAGENAGAVLDVLGLYICKKGGSEEIPTTLRPTNIPKNAMAVRATSTFTHVADTVTEGTIAFDDFVPLRDVTYKIIGMAANGASGCGARLVFKEGANEKDRPGVPVADTSTGLEYQMFYGDFGEFRGQTLPNLEVIAVAADAVTNLNFLIVPVSGGGK